MIRPRLALVFALLLTGCGITPSHLAGTTASSLDASARKLKLPVENWGMVNSNLYRGGLPSDADMASLVKMGVKTDIDLMDPESATEKVAVAHEQQVAAKVGLKFVNVALPWGVRPPQVMVDTVYGTITDPASQPVYIHCHHGRDRTGCMVAYFRVKHDGYSAKQALAEMETYHYDPKPYPWITEFVLSLVPASGSVQLPGFSIR